MKTCAARPDRLAFVAALGGLFLLAPGFAFAEPTYALRGLGDGEYWHTDEGSALLARNNGDPCGLGRLRLFGGVEFDPRVQVLGIGTVEAGHAIQAVDPFDAEFEQVLLRVRPAESSRFTFDGGKIPSPVGAFTSRRFSNINPLIGEPDTYNMDYPWGGQASAKLGTFDLRAAVLDLPVVNQRYTPEPGRKLRPHLAAGWAPMAGLRIGTSFTKGTYLNPDDDAMMPPGQTWEDFDQRIIGTELQFSRGYFEFNGEFLFTRYDAPTVSEPLDGYVHYEELKYTWTPRFYTAFRFEQNNYPYVQPLAPGVWLARVTNFYDGELGVGYRPAEGTLLKVAYRMDDWPVDDFLAQYLPDGHAFAFQISQSFDVPSLFRKPE